MKQCVNNPVECVQEKFLKLPNVQKFDLRKKSDDGFVADVEMDDGFCFSLHAFTMSEVYPSTVLKLVERKKEKREMNVLVAPYVSGRTAEICEKNGMGYFDYAGNCWFVGHSIYLSEKGNKNPQPKQYKTDSVFERSSVVSSAILRELFKDVNRPWKLKLLSESVGCSIGLVSKVMAYLKDNAWVESTPEGYIIREPGGLLKAWSEVYRKKENSYISCYSFDAPVTVEDKLRKMKQETGIEYYLTGFSGGVRYAPVVRYNKVHVYIAPEDFREAMDYLEIKEVDSGANVAVLSLENEVYIKDSRVVNGDSVVSPLQAYLDSMTLKGRGEELAEAILRREIVE